MQSAKSHSNRFSSRAQWICAAIVAATASVIASAGAMATVRESSRDLSTLMDDSYLWAMEEEFNEDFNGDGYIGQPPTPPGGGGGTGG